MWEVVILPDHPRFRHGHGALVNRGSDARKAASKSLWLLEVNPSREKRHQKSMQKRLLERSCDIDKAKTM